MPGMSLSMGLSMRQSLQQRLTMEMRLEQRLVLSQIQKLHGQLLLEKEGVEDPMRVRFFEMKTGPHKKISTAIKILEPKTKDDPFEEAANLDAFKKLGFSAPELMAVAEEDDKAFMLTRFEDKSANLATLVSNSTIRDKFLELINIRLTPELLSYLTKEMSTAEQAGLLAEIAKRVALPEEDGESVSDMEEFCALYKQRLQGSSIKFTSIPGDYREKVKTYLRFSLAAQLGREVAALHKTGVCKSDISPRNILLIPDDEGGVKIMHTGFRNISFAGAEVSREQRIKNLNEIATAFEQGMPEEESRKYVRAFMRGYLDKTAEFIERGLPHEEEEEPAVTIQDSTKDRLRRILGSTGYFPVEAPAKKTPDQSEAVTTSVIDQFEEVVLSMPMDQLRKDTILERWIKILESEFAATDRTASFHEVRGRKVVLALLETYRSMGHADLHDIEGVYEDELRMTGSTASRYVKPILDRLHLPHIDGFGGLMAKFITLRIYIENLTKSTLEQYEVFKQCYRGKYSMPSQPRTHRKYLTQLYEEGKIPEIKDHGTRVKLARRFEAAIGQENPIEVEALTAGMKVQPENAALFIKILKMRFIRERACVAAESGQPLDHANLAILLDMTPIEVEKIAKVGICNIGVIPDDSRMPEIRTREVVDRVMARDGEEAAETARIPEGEAEAPVEESTATEEEPAPPVEAPAAPPAPSVEVSDQHHIDHILRKIELDPAYANDLLATELGITAVDVRNIVNRVYVERGLVDQERSVHRLIQSQPGVEDADIHRETGLSITDIHLIVRPLLLGGGLRSGRQQ